MSTLRIIFNVNAPENSLITFVHDSQSYSFDVVAVRTQSFEVTADSDLVQFVSNLSDAINTDTSIGAMVENVTEILLEKEGQFTSGIAVFNNGASSQLLDVEFIIDNITEDYEVTITQEPSENSCETVLVKVVSNIPTVEILSPVGIDFDLPNTSFEFEFPRGQQLHWLSKPQIGVNHSEILPTVDLFEPEITIDVSNVESDTATVTVNSSQIGTITLGGETNPQNATQATFTGVEYGIYTLTVQEPTWGCVFTTQVTVQNPLITNAFHLVSKLNSIRFAEREEGFKTDENTLSCEEKHDLNHKGFQVWKNEVITTQLKTSYGSVKVNIIKDGETTLLEELQPLSSNLNQTISTPIGVIQDDSFSDGWGVIFFEIPEEVGIGSIISFNGYERTVTSIGYHEDSEAFCYIVDREGEDLGAETSTFNAQVMVNYQDYELYEFDIDMSQYMGENLRVEIVLSDPIYGEKKYVSEEIRPREELEHYLQITSKSTKNNDINYSTGIEHLIYVPLHKYQNKDEQTADTNITDTNVDLYDSTLNEGTEFLFEPRTTELGRKIKKLLLQDIVTIDGVGYTYKNFETQDRLGDTNLYVLKATMLKNNYKNQIS